MASTRVVQADPRNPPPDLIKEAARVIAGGGLVVVPTETVYGIAASMRDADALERLSKIKERPRDKPYSLHIGRPEQLAEFAVNVKPAAFRLMDAFWPGPLTLVLLSKDKGTIGMRMPDHAVALAVINEAGVPVVLPSANISGKRPPVRFCEAMEDLEGLVDLAIDAGDAPLGKESTVVDVSGASVTVLREGAIRKVDIERVVLRKTVLFVCTGNSCRSVMAKAMLEKMLRQKRRFDVEVLSAGLAASYGMGATRETREVLAAEGLDVSAHRSQRVTRHMLDRADIILVMERMHETKLLELAPEVKNRLFLLKEFAKINSNNLDILDPIGGSLGYYQEILAQIREAVSRIVEII